MVRHDSTPASRRSKYSLRGTISIALVTHTSLALGALVSDKGPSPCRRNRKDRARLGSTMSMEPTPNRTLDRYGQSAVS
jgi:hypothetical protein